MRWERDSGGLVVREWTPDSLAARDERLAWAMRNGRSWSLLNGHLSEAARSRQERVADDLREMMQVGRTQWKSGLRDLALRGVPVGAEGTYGALAAYPPAQSLAAVTGGTANVAWWSAATYSPIPANSILAPQAYRVVCAGTITSSAASQTVIPSANCGTAVGTGLGAGPTITLGSTITNALWYQMGDLTIRTAGTSGTIIAQLVMKLGTTAGASTTITHGIWGNTVQTVDFTVAQGITIGATPSATGVSVTPTQVHMMDWN